MHGLIVHTHPLINVSEFCLYFRGGNGQNCKLRPHDLPLLSGCPAVHQCFSQHKQNFSLKIIHLQFCARHPLMHTPDTALNILYGGVCVWWISMLLFVQTVFTAQAHQLCETDWQGSLTSAVTLTLVHVYMYLSHKYNIFMKRRKERLLTKCWLELATAGGVSIFSSWGGKTGNTIMNTLKTSKRYKQHSNNFVDDSSDGEIEGFQSEDTSALMKMVKWVTFLCHQWTQLILLTGIHQTVMMTVLEVGQLTE